MSTLDRELLKPSASVALHKHSNALVDVLPPEADSSISMLGADEKPDVSYSDIGGKSKIVFKCFWFQQFSFLTIYYPASIFFLFYQKYYTKKMFSFLFMSFWKQQNKTFLENILLVDMGFAPPPWTATVFFLILTLYSYDLTEMKWFQLESDLQL